jgi:hypothetical protein
MRELADRVIAEIDLAEARRRAQGDAPFSPAWDADMARVEDLERALWRIEHPLDARIR